MPTLLDIFRMELENESSDHMLEPTREIDKDDHKVGRASPEVRKLYSLGMQWDRAAHEAALAARYISDKTMQQQTLSRSVELNEKSEILMNIFWASLKDAFGLWDKPSVGIRRNWEVVWSESEVPPILGILGDLLGGRR